MRADGGNDAAIVMFGDGKDWHGRSLSCAFKRRGITPLLVPILTIAYGWQWTFIITGAVSLVWLVAWLVLYRNPPVDQSAYVAPPAPADNAIEAPAIAAAAATTPG